MRPLQVPGLPRQGRHFLQLAEVPENSLSAADCFSKVVTQTFKRVPWRSEKIPSKHCRCFLSFRIEQGRENTVIPKDQRSRRNDQLDQVNQENWSGQVEIGQNP